MAPRALDGYVRRPGARACLQPPAPTASSAPRSSSDDASRDPCGAWLPRTDLLGLALAHGVIPAAVGGALGLVVAATLSRFLNTLLYEVSRFDLLTNAGAAAMLVGVALAASYLPARRSAAEDPTVVLKQE